MEDVAFTTSNAEIYSDGSCNTEKKIGAWVAILLIGNEKLVLTGYEDNTTNNRMELVAVIKALEHMVACFPLIKAINIISDSQYVVSLSKRKEKLLKSQFTSKAGKQIRNVDLLKKFFAFEEVLSIRSEKIKAHQKKSETINYNIEADKLSRKIIRELVSKTI